MSELTSQLNVRMNRELKLAGDQALAEAGLSPSTIIRMLWEKLSEPGEHLNSILAALGTQPPTEQTATDQGDRMALVQEGAQLFEKGCLELGISVPISSPSTWKDVREESIDARLRERGMA